MRTLVQFVLVLISVVASPAQGQDSAASLTMSRSVSQQIAGDFRRGENGLGLAFITRIPAPGFNLGVISSLLDRYPNLCIVSAASGQREEDVRWSARTMRYPAEVERPPVSGWPLLRRGSLLARESR